MCEARRVGFKTAILHKIFHRHSYGYDSEKVLHNLTILKPIYDTLLFRNKSNVKKVTHGYKIEKDIYSRTGRF